MGDGVPDGAEPMEAGEEADFFGYGEYFLWEDIQNVGAKEDACQ